MIQPTSSVPAASTRRRPARASSAPVRGSLVRLGGALAVLLALSGCTPPPHPWGEVLAAPTTTTANPESPVPASPAPAPEAAEGSAGHPAAGGPTALAVLDTIPVKGRAPKTGYDREGDFGTAWLDVDRNGCDTRNDILARDLADAVRASGGCRVTSGTVTSPYTGEAVHFVRGNDTSTLVQIDHVVSLSNAWQTGAQQLSQDRRIALANDPANLLAVDQRSNAQKSDGDAATWLPSNRGFRCGYVARQVAVKAAYGLWVTEAEANAMRRVLAGCREEEAIAAPSTPSSAEAASEVPAPTAYETCDAARAAGAAPVRSGDAGYGRHLDRDGDGIGCQ